MKKESIVQFVGFATKLEFEDFAPTWEQFARQFQRGGKGIYLYEGEKKGSNRARYISIIDSKTADFRFAFMKGRASENFPEQNVKVIQLGGYSASQVQFANGTPKNATRVMAFLDPNNHDIAFCKKQAYTYLNIYEAYYENCSYSNIAEFLVPAASAASLIVNLEQENIQAAVYKKCPDYVAH
jgi:hypothetical protein